MSVNQTVMPTAASNCTFCGTVGPPTVYAYPDDGVAPLVLCPRCARDPAQLRALVRALRSGVGVVKSEVGGPVA